MRERGLSELSESFFCFTPPSTASLCQLLSATGPAFSLDFLGCFLNVMENVSGAWTSDRQTFVLVLFLNHLSPWIWREVLIGLPLRLRHVSFPPRVFTCAAQGSTFPAKSFDVTISTFTFFDFLFSFFFFTVRWRLQFRSPRARFVD